MNLNRMGMLTFRAFAVATVAIAQFSLVGCSGGAESKESDGTKPAPTKVSAGEKLKIGLCFDSGGKGDGSFNDSANAGLELAVKDLGVEGKTVDSKSEKDYETNIEGLVGAGCKVIFGVGFAQKTAIETVAAKHPDVKFGLIDDESKASNVRSLLFSEEQGSFLAGYVAALTSKTGKLGFVGGKTMPLIKKFEAGYGAGIAYAGKGELLPAKYSESWDDAVLGKSAAITLFDQGADVVFHAAGRCGKGVLAAAQERKLLAIGCDSDQDGQAPGFVLTSMLKRVDHAVFQTIKDAQDGKFTPGTVRYDLKAKGVGLTEFKFTKERLAPDTQTKLDAVTKDIVDGKIVVPTTMDELAKYKASLKK